jgi:hypothetical protein
VLHHISAFCRWSCGLAAALSSTPAARRWLVARYGYIARSSAAWGRVASVSVTSDNSFGIPAFRVVCTGPAIRDGHVVDTLSLLEVALNCVASPPWQWHWAVRTFMCAVFALLTVGSAAVSAIGAWGCFVLGSDVYRGMANPGPPTVFLVVAIVGTAACIRITRHHVRRLCWWQTGINTESHVRGRQEPLLLVDLDPEGFDRALRGALN